MSYSVYAPEATPPVDVPAARKEYLVAWLSERLKAPVRVPPLDDLGFDLLGGRLLAAGDGPGALLIYEAAPGKRLVLYLCENDLPGAAATLSYARYEGVSVFYWFAGAFSYAVAAELDRAALRPIAEAVYRAEGG
jgi:anti-sigma factor RsiW